jgi:hypothetical protein
MKLLKLLLFNPHYLVVFIAIGFLYITELLVEIVSFPFSLALEGIEYLIKQLLKIVK